MKLQHHELEPHIARGLSQFYIISGDEPLLVQESVDAIASKAKAQGFSERTKFFAEARFDWQQVIDASQSLSLFATKKIIECRLTNGKLNKDAQVALKKLTEQLPKDVIIVLVMGKIETSQQRTQWFKHLESKAVFVPIWPIDRTHLPQWIKRRLQTKSLRVQPEAIHLLADYTEGNLLATHQAIEKLSLLYDNQDINLEMMQEAIHQSHRFDIFQLAEAFFNTKEARFAKMVHTLAKEGTAPSLVLWAVAKEVRQLTEMAEKLEQGQRIDALLKSFRVWPKRAPFVKANLHQYSCMQFEDMLAKLFTVDEMIKGKKLGNPWETLVQQHLQLSGKCCA